MAGPIREVEKLSIWDLCEILNHQAKVADMQKERLEKEKNKRKNKKKK